MYDKDREVVAGSSSLRPLTETTGTGTGVSRSHSPYAISNAGTTSRPVSPWVDPSFTPQRLSGQYTRVALPQQPGPGGYTQYSPTGYATAVPSQPDIPRKPTAVPYTVTTTTITSAPFVATSSPTPDPSQQQQGQQQEYYAGADEYYGRGSVASGMSEEAYYAAQGQGQYYGYQNQGGAPAGQQQQQQPQGQQYGYAYARRKVVVH
ncbi:hypothetical protein HK104_010962 [Borealophlyctis nickersoniae]|nr:hypothetical protein HK104_010962 [Borealophlyctis nickersoniae]